MSFYNIYKYIKYIHHGRKIIIRSNFRVQWSLYVDAKTQEKAMLIFQLVSEAIDLPLQIENCEPYWRNRSQYEITFTTTWEGVTPPEAVFRTLAAADTLAWEWNVRCPVEWEDGLFEFGGQSVKTKLANLLWIGFELEKEATQKQTIQEGTVYETKIP
ncbi:hypothetical protein SAMN05444416_101230 [Thermoactinomyces sp. DSM 45892]|nr:hypothetical protein SAMN05444416_101230 [Thermoactinomyces sp. DSM 45892]